MNIGEYSVKRPVISWLLVLILVFGGYYGFIHMGKLEDPNFTIKEVKIITYYPGATAQQVQDEVTYHIEEALQLMPQLKWIKMSISRPGMSDIQVTFEDKYKAKDFPDIYDEVRRKIADMQYKLPPGAQKPIIIDSFADVYGVYLALTGKGYSYRDMKDIADFIKKEIVLVDGVRKVVIGGVQPEVVYLDISREKMGELGISFQNIIHTLQSQNVVSDAGKVLVGDEYLRIQPTGEFQSVKQMEDLIISSVDKKLIRLKDFATIRREYKEVPDQLIYQNGKPALTLGISMKQGRNVVEVGRKIEQRFKELAAQLPLGMQLDIIYNQPGEVDKSVRGFINNVIASIVIVILVLLVFMGVSAGFIIGTILLITVAGTLMVMQLFGIDLQRISLGALIIALGMLVDNAIVVAEGMMIRIQAGMNAAKAAKEVVGKNAYALLGGTIIGILAFSAIGLSEDSTGEFTSSLFYVILISLLLSWLTAVSTTPLFCALFIKPKNKPGAGNEKDAYSGLLFTLYRHFLKGALRLRWLTVIIIVSLFGLSLYGFGFTRNGFFPDANTPMFFVEVWEVEGTDIRQTRDDTLKISNYIRSLEGVVKTTELIGGGDQRFSLVYEPKEHSPAYAQIIVQTETREQIEKIWEKTDHYMQQFPDIEPIIKPLRIGPGRDSKIEARISGPDATVLRKLSEKVKDIYRKHPGTKEIRDDWRQPVKLIKPVFNEQVGRQLGITHEDVSHALKYAFDGVQVGLYRDGIRLLPIYVRAADNERNDVDFIKDIQVWSPVLKKSVNINQVISSFETVWENTVIRGRDRKQTIIASCNPDGVDSVELFRQLRPKVEALKLPPGYSLVWGGEYEDSTRAQESLAKALPSGFLLMILTTIFLFAKVRQPLIIWLTVPLAFIGITAGLLIFNGAFDFMGLLGALSLIGLLIKNAIVLIEEIDQQIESGVESFQAILDSAVSRMRPVMMAAFTTILGMIPLLSDVFFVNMSIVIMMGLAFATVLTLILVPVLYAIFFKIKYNVKA